MARPRLAPKIDVPFLHQKQIECEAEVLLQEFGLKFYEVAKPPTPIDEIAELHLQLALEIYDLKALFPFADVQGAIWFEQGKIGIDQELDPTLRPFRLGRYHFTLAHEVGHWRLHRSHYLKNPAERRLFDDGALQPDVICRSSERKKPVEWQADYFAACILMPRKLICTAWLETHGSDRAIDSIEIRRLAAAGNDFSKTSATNDDSESADNALKEAYARPLAEQFGVSPEAMRIRLEHLNLFVKNKERSLFD